MSITVALYELGQAIARRGSLAYLVTVGDAGPRVVSVTVEVADGHVGAEDPDDGVVLIVAAGRHSAANAAARPQVTVFWPVDAVDPKHTLLVDGTASVSETGDQVVITPTAATLHRLRIARQR